MKKYMIKKRELEMNPILCEYMLNCLMQQGFLPVEVRSGGRFYFEYNERYGEFRYFCFLGVSGVMYKSKLKSLTEEIKRVFNSAEILNKGSRIRILKLDKHSAKERGYIDNIAKQHGLEKFDEDEYLNVVRKKYNDILYKSNIALSILMIPFLLLFAISAFFTHWIVAFFSVVPCFIAVMSLFTAYSLKHYS